MRVLLSSALCLVCASASAQLSLSSSLGHSDVGFACQDYSTPVGYTQTTSCQRGRPAFTARLGKTWPNGLGLETSLYYVEHALAKSSNPFIALIIDGRNGTGTYRETRYQYKSLSGSIALTGTLSLSESNTIDIKVGWARTLSELTRSHSLVGSNDNVFPKISTKAARYGPYFGATLAHAFSKHLAAVISLESLPIATPEATEEMLFSLTPSKRTRSAVASAGIRASF